MNVVAFSAFPDAVSARERGKDRGLDLGGVPVTLGGFFPDVVAGAAAAEAINEQSAKGMTFADVARRVGLNTTSVTYYFRRKEDLAAAAFENTLDTLGGMLDEAAAAGKAMSIHVEKYNPAMRLYRRLGFVTEEDKGVYDLMRWRAPEAPGGQVKTA